MSRPFRITCALAWLLPFIPSSGLPQSSAGEWITIDRRDLCITEGKIDDARDHRMMVDVPKMRAYVTSAPAQSVEMQFAYLGPTKEESRLGSGEMRRQFGLKLHAQDPCNLVYAIWRIEPESKLVVSVKTNPGEHTSAQCTNHGYKNVKPAKSSALPRLEPGQSHTLRAEITHADELRVFVDDREVWNGTIGPEGAALRGPAGIRTDNARLEFDLKARRPSDKTEAEPCKTGMGSD